MPFEIKENGEFDFALTAFGGTGGPIKGEVDFWFDVDDVLVTKTLAFTLNVLK